MGQEPTMTVRGCLRCGAIAFLLLLAAAPARADITAFIGANTTPDNRQTRGLAVGISLVVVGFEFEYANTPDSTGPGIAAPSLKTGMANVFLQTPFPIAGFQPYFTTGAGLYREKLAPIHQDTSFGFNTGGGVKMTLVGPLRLRVDYRVFKLGSGARFSPAHRVYAGLNLKF
jgi:opacity protein-like surface antigen